MINSNVFMSPSAWLVVAFSFFLIAALAHVLFSPNGDTQ